MSLPPELRALPGDARRIWGDAEARTRSIKAVVNALEADEAMLRASADREMPDDIFRTWVHESLHARQAFSRDYRSEYARFPGFEEGMVEGVARHLLCDRAGFAVINGSFDYYMAAYRALPAALGLERDAIWRASWRARPGDVRASFPTMLRMLYRDASGLTLSAVPLAKLSAAADTVFSAVRAKWVPDGAELTRFWEVALG